jgi:tetratricopeptide (TPR) repeat protein
VGDEWIVVVDGEEGKRYYLVLIEADGGRIVFDSPDSFHYLAVNEGFSSIYLVKEKINDDSNWGSSKSKSDKPKNKRHWWMFWLDNTIKEDNHDGKLVDAEVWYNKGNSFYASGRHEEAIRCYEEAIKINNEFVDAWLNKGSSLFDLGRYEEAIGCYEMLLKINQEYGAAWYNKGNSLSILDRHEEAIGCYEMSLKINPDYADAWCNKGVSLSVLGRHKEAIRCYEKSLKIDPEYADAWVNKGSCLYNSGEEEEGMRCIKKAAKLDHAGAKQLCAQLSIQY